MSKKVKRILTVLGLSIVVIGLFATDIIVSSKLGSKSKAEKEAQAQAEYKARDWENKSGFAEIMGKIIAKEKEEKQANLEKLQKELQDDAKTQPKVSIPATSKPISQEEKKDANLG